MKKVNSDNKLKIYFLIANLILLNLAFGLTNLIIFDTFFVPGWAYPSLLIFINSVAILNHYVANYTSINHSFTYRSIIRLSSEYILYFIFFVLIYWFSINSSKYYRVHIILFILSYGLLNLFNVWIFVKYLRSKIDIHKYKKIVMVGEGLTSREIVSYLEQNSWYGYRVEKIVSMSELPELESNIESKEVYINTQTIPLDEDMIGYLKYLTEEYLVEVKIFNSLFNTNITKKVSNFIGHIPIVKLFRYPLDSYVNRTIKRFFDIIVSLLIVFFVFSWLFPIIAFLIIIDNSGSVFYLQKRHGELNKIFSCIKFRSMKVNEKDEFIQAKKNDDRVTRVGKFIRKFNIDELPQIFNVLFGDMSIVGPRPHPIALNENFSSKIDKYLFRHLYKPGITGLAQVKGYRGETDTLDKMQNRIKYDRYYIQNWSFSFDVKIILLTVYNIFKGDKNAY